MILSYTIAFHAFKISDLKPIKLKRVLISTTGNKLSENCEICNSLDNFISTSFLSSIILAYLQMIPNPNTCLLTFFLYFATLEVLVANFLYLNFFFVFVERLQYVFFSKRSNVIFSFIENPSRNKTEIKSYFCCQT